MSVTPLRKSQNHPIFQDIGTIKSIEADSSFVIETETGAFHATRAVCCLVDPIKEDEVLFAGRADGDLFVLGVLKRNSEEPTTLSTEGDTRFNVRKGRLSFVAKEGVDIVTGAVLSLASKEFKVNTNSGNIFIDKLAYIGHKASAEVEAVKFFVSVMDTVADRLSQRTKLAYKIVEILDHVKAKQIEYRAEENLKLRAHNNLFFADLLTKIDSDQIQLG